MTMTNPWIWWEAVGRLETIKRACSYRTSDGKLEVGTLWWQVSTCHLAALGINSHAYSVLTGHENPSALRSHSSALASQT